MMESRDGSVEWLAKFALFFNLVSMFHFRCKMRHRDPRLFYLTMEVTVRRPGVKSLLELDDEARPALLQACHPKGDSR